MLQLHWFPFYSGTCSLSPLHVNSKTLFISYIFTGGCETSFNFAAHIVCVGTFFYLHEFSKATLKVFVINSSIVACYSVGGNNLYFSYYKIFCQMKILFYFYWYKELCLGCIWCRAMSDDGHDLSRSCSNAQGDNLHLLLCYSCGLHILYLSWLYLL